MKFYFRLIKLKQIGGAIINMMGSCEDNLLTPLLIRVNWCLSRRAELEAEEDEVAREDEEDSDPDFE